MKQQIQSILVVLLSLFLLSACSEKSLNNTIPRVPEETTLETAQPVPQMLTEREVLNLFRKYETTSGRTVINCVPVPDSACGVVGVVQYTDRDHDGVMFVFLTMDGPLGGRCGTPNCTAVEDTLEYLGEDTISYQFQTAEGHTITNTISFSDDGNGNTSFKIETQSERKE
ncbi:MAG: hypothetical protein MR636_02670 [Clostridiales bacterium]|nr:hypothetical protein [Clostridiales bacterium]